MSLALFNQTVEEIRNESYCITPLTIFIFKEGVLGGEKHTFKGVPLLPADDEPIVEGLSIKLAKQCVFMQPIDELVLTSLGLVLTNRLAPSYKKRLSRLEKSFSKRGTVKKLQFIQFHSALLFLRQEKKYKALLKLLAAKPGMDGFATCVIKQLFYIPYISTISLGGDSYL